MAMEDLSSIFGYQETVEELKQTLVLMRYELKMAKIQAEEEARKNKEHKENIDELFHLLDLAYKERDEAKDQIRKLLINNLSSAAAPPPESSLRSNSGVTESNSSGNPLISSPGEALYDVVSPAVDSGKIFGREFRSPVTSAGGRENEIVYSLAKGRPLPAKGQLLKAVTEAGPLLQTLLVAGNLPQWRNPPPLQSLQAPPVRIDGEIGPHLLKRGVNNLAPCGPSQALNFAGGGVGGFGAAALVSPAVFGFGSQMIPTPKRPRIQ